MNSLADAIASIPVKRIGPDQGVDETREICSGGERKSREPVPGLFASRSLALQSWTQAVLDLLDAENAIGWRFGDAPIIDKWQVTIMDSQRQHRIAEDRWSVAARIGFVRMKPSDVVPQIAA